MNKYRTELAALVRSIDPVDEIERLDQIQTLGLIQSGADIHRGAHWHLPDPHLVAYFVPVDWQRRLVFLVHHTKSGLMLPPGGHIELDDLPDITVERECQEELGVMARFDTPIGRRPLLLTANRTKLTSPSMPQHTDISFWYVTSLDRGQALQFTEAAVPRGQWYTVDELWVLPPELTDRHLSRFVAKLLLHGFQ
jgi:8-oxo-dGTP diphosphatase